MKIKINEKSFELDAVASDTPLLWVLRDYLHLTGTRYGCGIGSCGACTVLVDGEAVRSCQLPVSQLVDKQVTTIEGLSKEVDHPVQQAWSEEQVAQCGYCQSGQILTAVALLSKHQNPDEQMIRDVMSGVLCRCGTYPRIVEAIKVAAKRMEVEAK